MGHPFAPSIQLLGVERTCRAGRTTPGFDPTRSFDEQLEQFVSCWIEVNGSGWELVRAPWLRGRGCHDDIHVETQVEIHRKRCRAGLRDDPVRRGICQRRWWPWWRRWLSRRRWLPRRWWLPWRRRLPWRRLSWWRLS